MLSKLLKKIIKSEAIFKVKKANARINLLIVEFAVTFERTLNLNLK